MERRLAAILAADVVGYTRLMGADEAGTLARLKALRAEIIDPEIARYNGRIVKLMGDGALVEFASVVDAVACAAAIQRTNAARKGHLVESEWLTLRIGVNLGDVIVEDDDIYGDGVNIAARLEGLAEPGGICISDIVYQSVKAKLDLAFDDLGALQVKNVAEPVRAYHVRLAKEEADKSGERPTLARRDWRQWAIAAAVAVLIVVAGGLAWQRPWAPDVAPASIERMAFPLPEKPSIAVLPFDNLSGDPEQEFLADGLTEQIITTLSKIPDLFVIASTSTITYKDKPVLVKQVAEEQGVHYVLEGSVQRSGNRVRINAQLIDALAGNHIWAEAYDREFDDLFALQDDITHNVAVALQVELTLGAEVQGRRPEASNPEAFLLAHKALFHLRKFNREDQAKAHELIRRAREAAPSDVFPLRLEGWIHLADARYGWSESREKSLLRAEQIAQRSQELGGDDAGTYFLLSGIHRARRELDKAIEFIEKTVQLNPNHGGAWGTMGQLLNYAGRPKEAISAVKKGMRLSPYYPAFMAANLGLSYMMIGEYDKAVAAYEEVLERNALVLFSHERLTAIYALKGDMEKAHEYAAKVLELKPDFTVESWSEVLFYQNKEDLDRELNALRKAGLPEVAPTSSERMAFPLPDKPSIAVLPFVNMSDESEQEYFADGMTEDLITDLSKVSDLFVIARNSTFVYKGRSVPVRQVSEDLGVRYVLEGSVRRAGDTVRINAQLIDATTGGHLWAERYDGNVTDIFAVQDSFVREIVGALALNLSEREQKEIANGQTSNIEAREAFQKGWEHYLRYTAADNAKAAEHFGRAAELDPEYGRAYSALGMVYVRGCQYRWHERLGMTPSGAFAYAEHYLSEGEKHSSSLTKVAASQIALYDKRHDKAFTEAARAIALDPNDPEAQVAMGLAMITTGRPEAGLEFVATALRLSPTHPTHYVLARALAYFIMNDLEQAAAILGTALERDPSAVDLAPLLAASYAHLGRREEARAALQLWKPDATRTELQAKLVGYHFPYTFSENGEFLDRLTDGLVVAALPGDVTVESLLLTLRQSEKVVERRSAARTLGHFGDAAKAAVPALQELLDDPALMYVAERALKKIDSN